MTQTTDTLETEPRTIAVVLAELNEAIDAPRPELPTEDRWEEEQGTYRRELRNLAHRVDRLKRELGLLLVERVVDDADSLVQGRLTDKTGAEYDATLLILDLQPAE